MPLAPLPSPAAPADAGTPQEAIVAVRLNGRDVAGNAIVLRSDTTFYVSGDDLGAWHVKLPARPDLQHDGRPFYALSALHASAATLEGSNQLLAFDLPGEAFTPNVVGPGTFEQPALAGAGRGAFLNYDLRRSTAPGTQALGAVFDMGIAVGAGVLGTGLITSSGAPSSRLETAFRLDDPGRRRTLRVGDTSSNGGDAGSSIPYAGVQLATNFATQPELITTPTLALRGTVDRASTMDLLLNGDTLLHADLPPGPYVVESISPLGGTGRVQAVIRDASGRTQIVNSRYTASSTMLKPGIEEYSLDAGFVHTFGVGGRTGYGPAMFEATDRRGLSNRLTGAAHVEGTPGAMMASLGGVTTVASGVLRFDASGTAGRGAGGRADLDYTFASRGINVGFNLAGASAGFRIPLGCVEAFCDPVVFDEGVRFGISIPHGRSVALSASRVRRGSGNVGSSTLARFSTPFAHGTAVVAVGSFTGSTRVSSVYLQYVTLLSRHRIVTATASEYNGKSAPQLQYSEPLPQNGRGLGYDLRVQQDQAGGARGGVHVIGQSQYATVNASVDRFAGGLGTQLDVRGGVAFIPGGVMLGHAIDDAFGVVELEAYPGTRVYVAGLDVGRTDRHGRIMLPSLQPYVANQVRLESADLPFTASVDSSVKTTVPRYRSPVVVHFSTHSPGGVTFALTTAPGIYVPVGTVISLRGTARTWPVGEKGLSYIDGLPPARHVFTATMPAGACTFAVVIPSDVLEIPNLGNVPCRAAASLPLSP